MDIIQLVQVTLWDNNNDNFTDTNDIATYPSVVAEGG